VLDLSSRFATIVPAPLVLAKKKHPASAFRFVLS
jgi:hypothetical protein